MMDIFELVKKNDYKTLKDNIHNLNVNELTIFGENALFFTKSYEIAKLLIDNGININQLDVCDCNSLFHVYDYNIAKLLIDNGININQIDAGGENALSYRKPCKLIRLLIDNGININIWLSAYAIRNRWDVIPVFDKASLDNPRIMEHKNILLLINDYDNTMTDESFDENDYCYNEIYRRLRKYFNVNTNNEVDLIIKEL